MDFSLFYFADDADSGDRYRLLLEGARFADTHGFAAVWTPERHFHRFGGLFPNPAVAAAAVAAVTTRVGVRAGSVVAPLHHPVRIAEDWAMVDNLSHGRAGISLASGWNPQDFLLAPDSYERRRELTVEAIGTLRKLWRGEPCPEGPPGGIYPRPVQADPPIWLTSGGSLPTFEAAGRLGVGVLTNLLTYELDALPARVRAYRQAYAAAGHPGRGHVALMLHACLGDDREAALAVARPPLHRYLMTSLDLNLRAAGLPVGAGPPPGAEVPAVVARAADRYLERDGLFGTVGDALGVVRRAADAGVDEIACLIDFGVPIDAALAGLDRLDELRRGVSLAR
ncbi:MupA/Atu3671 family FMN-dependent luciferase-like monooxygenase [Actinoplanes sp. RD1]|uniref:MupA/Atu3671 family FMN-dependent luciferase-like monooxygenase n=1 Tax=Actinoplanes sp. RD1 TaxID=3064538 RepID=UPI002742818C|nr:MupA/Atu3671 family FMN-dependent luciferase-like monooxygenase [Actinoplanes sp. RD1]